MRLFVGVLIDLFWWLLRGQQHQAVREAATLEFKVVKVVTPMNLQPGNDDKQLVNAKKKVEVAFEIPVLTNKSGLKKCDQVTAPQTMVPRPAS